MLLSPKSRNYRAVQQTAQAYAEAVANAEVVIQEWLETAKELGRDIPRPKGRLVYA